MPITYRLQPEQNRVLTEIDGEFTFEEIQKTVSSALTDPLFRPGFDILSDHRRIGEPLQTGDANRVVKLMKSFREKLHGCRWAIVTSKPASLGMMNMLAVLLGDQPFEVQVFLSMEKAERWLEDRRPPVREK